MHFESFIAVVLIYNKILITDKWDWLGRGFCAEYVAKGDILESESLTDVVIIWNI